MTPLLLVLALGCPKPPTVDYVRLDPPAAPAPAAGGDVEVTIDVPTFDHGASTGVTDLGLVLLLEEHWELQMLHSPTWASSLGDRRFDDRLGDSSPAGHERRRTQRDAFITQARALDVAKMNRADKLTHRLFVEQLETGKAVDVCRFEEWTLSPRNNPVTTLGWLAEIRPVESMADAGKLKLRYAALHGVIMGELATLEVGVEAERFANKESTRRVLEMVQAELDKPTAEWAAVTAVTFTDDVDEAHQQVVRDDLAQILDEQVRPALFAYHKFLDTKILPNTREGDKAGLVGLGDDGAACYTALIKSHTSLDKTADEIHQVGLDELEKIHAEFEDLGETVFGTRDRGEIFAKLRTQPDLYFETEEQVEQKAALSLAAAKAAMPDYFGRLPEADCIVKRVPEHEAPYTTVAYYRQPAGDGSRPGEYRINTYEPATRPRHEAAVLAFHESIPGHHLQIAISQELADMPAFRRHMGMTAYVEGWALYTERLADEMGLYESDTDRLGMLSYDSWRASRLVVDTGVHSKGWTREQAIEFMVANTPLAENNIDNEVDRYISWPGQALAYKLGQLEMWRLRHRSEGVLGDNFDIKGFHDVVLGSGAVPLGVLDDNVGDWIDSQVR